MSNGSDSTTNGSEMTDNKIMWFEFLLRPQLLGEHLKNENSNPQPFELMSQFLTNALTISTTSLSTLTTTNNNTNGSEEQNGFGSGQQTSAETMKRLIDSKKSTAIRYLSFNIMAHLNWDLDELESNLPPTQQDFLLNEFIRYCDLNDSPTGCKLFAHILYYRWILRYILRSNYPLKSPKGPLIPLTLQQQIDPCFVSNEALDCLMKKLQEQYAIAVSDLEKVVSEKQKGNRVEVWMPSIECFDNTPGNEFVCNWNRSVRIDINDVMDDILYDIGRWFFFREDYPKANTYLESISMSKRNSYNHLDGYLVSTRELISVPNNRVDDIEIIDLEKQALDSIEKMTNGQTFDITKLEELDVNEVKKSLEKAFNKCVDNKQKNRLLRLSKYLSNRIKGLNQELIQTIFTKSEHKIQEIIIKDDDNDIEMIEEGEIDGDEEPVVKDPELLLLEATDPEVIQSLVVKTQKHPLMINSKWVLPMCQSVHLKHLSQVQYDKCHLILAKANQLRNANLFIEARVLYLSLLEDIQASLPQLAEVIRWELLRTDLEYHFDTNDVDERQINDLIAKCNRTLRTIDKTNLWTEFADLTELCAIFLLESCPQTLIEYSDSSVSVLRFSSFLSSLSIDSTSNSNQMKAKELWEMLVNYFVNPNLSVKRGPVSTIPLTFANSLVSFVSKFKGMTLISLIISCISKIHNIIRDNSTQELTIGTPFSQLWQYSLTQSLSSTLDLNSVSSALNKLLDEFLVQKPNELYLLKVKAELSLIDGLFADAIKYFTQILIIKTKFFTSFSHLYSEEDSTIHRMIQCCVRLGCHTQAALLHQLTREPNYSLAFKALSERNCNDSCDDLYECIWDTTLLEFLINLHHRRGEVERKTKAIQLMGNLELNSNNSEIVLKEAADSRRGRLLRVFARTYL